MGMNDTYDVALFEPGSCDRCGPSIGHVVVAEEPLGFWAKGTYRFVECNGCGVRYYSPRYREEAWLSLLNQGKLAADAELLETTGTWSNCPSQYDPERQKVAVRSYYAGMIRRASELADEPCYRFLDVGCHVGRAIEAANELGMESHGVDIDGPALVYARRKARGVQHCRFQDASYVGPFDVILMCDMIEHSFTPFRDLTKALGIVRVGGVLVVKTFVDDLPGTDHAEGSAWYQALGHEWHFRIPVLRGWLSAAGWEVVEEQASDSQAQVTFICVRPVVGSTPEVARDVGTR